MDYFTERYVFEKIKLNRTLADLPSFCRIYFFGTEQRLKPTTLDEQSLRIRKFFNFLHEKIDGFKHAKPTAYSFRELNAVNKNHIELYIEYLHNDNSNNSICNHLSTLKTFFTYFHQSNEIAQNPFHGMCFQRRDTNGIGITSLNPSEIKKLLTAVDSDYRRINKKRKINEAYLVRDKTVLIMFLLTGIRLSELVGLDFGDIDLDNASFKVRRKGGRYDICYMTDELIRQLKIYFQYFPKTSPQEPIFTNICKRRLKTRSIQLMVEKHCNAAGIKKKITPHKLRSTFGTNMYEKTRDIYIVADLLGHKDIRTTTKHYATIKEHIKREALKDLHVT
jgi:site-specific recombinase XerD